MNTTGTATLKDPDLIRREQFVLTLAMALHTAAMMRSADASPGDAFNRAEAFVVEAERRGMQV